MTDFAHWVYLVVYYKYNLNEKFNYALKHSSIKMAESTWGGESYMVSIYTWWTKQKKRQSGDKLCQTYHNLKSMKFIR